MNRNKLLIGAGIIAVIGIMTANLQYTYSDYGIKTASLHSEVLAQSACSNIEYALEAAKRAYFISNCSQTHIGNVGCYGCTECKNSNYSCESRCWDIKSLEEQLRICRNGGNPGGGNSSGTSTGTGTGTIQQHLVVWSCTITIDYNGYKIQKQGTYGTCEYGGTSSCSAYSCRLP